MSKPEDLSFSKQLGELAQRLEQILPTQAPIKDFVHHNTLHGLQHLTFPEAMSLSRRRTGARGFLPSATFRDHFRKGRITEKEIRAAIRDSGIVACETERVAGTSESDILFLALTHLITKMDATKTSWVIDEERVFEKFQRDISGEARDRLLTSAEESNLISERACCSDLWSACLETLGLQNYILRPEDLLDPSPERAGALVTSMTDEAEGETPNQLLIHRNARKESEALRVALFKRTEEDLTLAGLLQAVSGYDILDDIRPLLQRQLAAHLDLGVASLRNPEHHRGFFSAWRSSAIADKSWLFEDLPDWIDHLEGLSDDPIEVIHEYLQRLGLAREHWMTYLGNIALEIPGWSGMVLQHRLCSGHDDQTHIVAFNDYLAVRLVLERLYAQRLCSKHWNIEASLTMLNWYFRRRRSEFLVRYSLFDPSIMLPEYLSEPAHGLVGQSDPRQIGYDQWQSVSDTLHVWQRSEKDRDGEYQVLDHAWRMFQLAQYAGISAVEIRKLETNQINSLFSILDKLDGETSGYVWLQAYEQHYRDRLFNAVRSNVGRGRWKDRNLRPFAQTVFCMDDREEGFRRHLEEINPEIETLGAAAHFNVFVDWYSVHEDGPTTLCPIVAKPSHEVHEAPSADQAQTLSTHISRLRLRRFVKNFLGHRTRVGLVWPTLSLLLTAPMSLAVMVLKLLGPSPSGRWIEGMRRRFDLEVATQAPVNAETQNGDATPDLKRQGFTDSEQLERVFTFLRNIGLESGFSAVVAVVGHGSHSQNNPHLAAYDCGACSGRHSGPNARILAAMANRTEIRALLKEKGLDIPEDTWFVGSSHNTCSDEIVWYDQQQIPATCSEAFSQLKENMDEACRRSAHERCRKFDSAPASPSLDKALQHVQGRATDFSQVRPELGHAGHAAAFVGRRSLSQGVFFDRRVFLISYNPDLDANGEVLERLLLANGPVGAGISLEYYFSTVDNDRYGSGSKIAHNITGFFGVMDGVESDLRTGLPKQMIEIHEAMRLQMLVEAETEMLAEIYARQPALQEMIGNGWLLLSAIHPESGVISVFNPDRGFEVWNEELPDLSTMEESKAWYAGEADPLPPTLIGQCEVTTHA